MPGKRKAAPTAPANPPAPGCRGLSDGKVNGVPRYKLEDRCNVAMLRATFFDRFGYVDHAKYWRDEALMFWKELTEAGGPECP